MAVRNNEDLTNSSVSADKKIVSLKPKRARTKTAAERQKSHYARKIAAGWRKGWLDPETLNQVDRFGCIEAVADHNKRMMARLLATEEKLKQANSGIDRTLEHIEYLENNIADLEAEKVSLNEQLQALQSRGLWARLWNR
jgi:hypothetical protein